VHKVKDADLVFLLKIVNKLDASIGVTLLSKGTFITGQMISGKQYYENVVERMKQAGDAGVALSSYFTNSAENVYSPSDDSDAPTNFLHLKDVKIRSPEGSVDTLNGAYLRMKVEEIDGHFIGAMS
jgi:hypothetical protein